MTPHNKLRLANFLMVAGISPVLIGMIWMVASFPASKHGHLFIAEALMKIGFAYMFALVVGCGGAVWSVLVEKRNAGVRVGGTTAIRVLVVLMLIVPFVL